MSKREKLLSRLQNSLNDVRFEEACKIAEGIGFKRKGGKGSHCTYAHAGENLLLNFQNCNGFIKPYQARQLLKMVEKYGCDQDLPD